MSALSTLFDIVTRVKTSDPDREALLEMLRDLNGEIRAEKKEALDTLDDVKADRNAILELVDDYKNQLETASALEMALRRELSSKTKTIEELYAENTDLQERVNNLAEALKAHNEIAYNRTIDRYVNPDLVNNVLVDVCPVMDESYPDKENRIRIVDYLTGEIIAIREGGFWEIC